MPKNSSPLRALCADKSVLRFSAVAVHVAVLSVGTIAPANAAEPVFPTWADVQAARSSEGTVTLEVARIERLLEDMKVEAATKKDAALALGQIFFDAQELLDNAYFLVAEKQLAVDKAETRAKESAQLAGRVAAATYKSAGTDLTAKLVFAGKHEVDSVLRGLSTSARVSEIAQSLFTRAEMDRRDAKTLTDQATRVRDKAAVLSVTAENAMYEAQTAADAAQLAVDENTAQQARLASQLDALKTNRAITEAEYAEGAIVNTPVPASVSAKPYKPGPPSKPWEPETSTPADNPLTPVTNEGAPPLPSAGWIRPSSGTVSSVFGPRVSPGGVGSTNHMGIDFAPSCNSPIIAASGGRVIFAGPNGGYGNFVKIDHGAGLTTGYAHIVDDGIKVRAGDIVTVGQLIALVGTTGNSTGCHLHFEVRTNGVAENPAPFLRARGISV